MNKFLDFITTFFDSKKMAAIEQTNANIQQYGARDLVDFDLTQQAHQPNATEIRGLATGGILFFWGDNPIKVLPAIKPEVLVERKAATAEWWGINDTEEALDILHWLRQEGHRKEFREKLKTDFSHWQQLFANNPFLKTRSVSSVAAWDYARSVNVARWCYDYGYLSWAQAWEFIDAATRLAVRDYDSWESFATGFVAGRIMWNPESDGHDDIAEISRYLLESKYSPWRDIPWLPYPYPAL